MPRVKEKTKIKKGRTASEDRIEGEISEVPVIPAKGKKILPLEEPEAIIGGEEKAVVEEDVILPAVAEDEETAEEASLDDEEVNPFGDKWEE
jgi:hypothetical protein